MNSKLFILLVTAIIGVSYLTLDFSPFHLTKQATPPTYNQTISQRYAAFAKIAYCPKNLVQNWSCKECKTHNQIKDLHIISGAKRDIFGFAFYDTVLEKIVLVWRGSIDDKNYVNDFTYEKIPYTCKQCEVHVGFYQAYRSVATETYNAVQTLVQKYPNAKMTVTGHSLGAALTTISAIEMNKKSPKLANELHTFGCPRVGNAKLAQFIRDEFETLFRVIHSHDMFTHLPEQEQNFHHFPFEVLYDENMTTYQICDDSGEDPTCSNLYSPNYNKKDHRFYFYNMDETDC